MRLKQLLNSKLHHARVTYVNAEYVGSIEVDGSLMDLVGIADGEMVHIWSVDGEARIQTYAFRGPTGVIGINGGAARLFQVGERIIIASFDFTDEQIVPRIVLLDDENRVVRNMTPFSVHG